MKDVQNGTTAALQFFAQLIGGRGEHLHKAFIALTFLKCLTWNGLMFLQKLIDLKGKE